MEINLLTISKLSSEIIATDKIKIEHVEDPRLSDLMDNIYDKYPALWYSEEYKLFWRYSKYVYFQIDDYISYIAAIRMMLNKTIYLLLNDIDDQWKENISYLQELDRIEEEERIERERDIYDVKISRKSEISIADAEATNSVSSTTITGERLARTDGEFISYAIRKLPEGLDFTTDMSQQINLMLDLQKGYPKFRTELRILPDIVFEKRVLKVPKGAKRKKDKKKEKKNSKKDKKKGKTKK